jgi:hypothetical protein
MEKKYSVCPSQDAYTLESLVHISFGVWRFVWFLDHLTMTFQLRVFCSVKLEIRFDRRIWKGVEGKYMSILDIIRLLPYAFSPNFIACKLHQIEKGFSVCWTFI